MNKKIGFMVDDENFDYFNYKLVKWSIDNKNISEVCFIKFKDDYKKKVYRFKWQNILRILTFKIIYAFEKMFIPKKYKKYFKNYKLNSYKISRITISPILKKNIFSFYFNEDDVIKLKKKKLDIILRLGSGIIRGEILNVSKNGIISLHHGDPASYRGGPPGFWELLNKEPNIYFMIQKLTDELDNGQIIHRGSIQTKNYFLLNQILLKEKSIFFIKKAIKTILKIEKNNLIKNCKNYIYLKKFYTFPEMKYLLKYIFQVYISHFFKKFIKYKVNYEIFYQNKNWNKLSINNSKKLNSASIVADPFFFKRNNVNYLFAEEIDNNNFGRIVVFDLNKNEKIGNLNFNEKEKFHKSFPYIFEENKKIYMVPECHKVKQIRLYESILFPLEWKLSEILIDNVEAVDSFLFKKNRKFWLLTNICSAGLKDFSSELHIFSSKKLIKGKWTKHKNNPVINDGVIGRSGGVIFDKQKIYRISQTHNFLNYGDSLRINLIKKINDNEYIEEGYFDNDNQIDKNNLYAHHLYCKNNFTVFDKKR
jgi:hypothetical protein